jgi:hypothetical protein
MEMKEYTCPRCGYNTKQKACMRSHYLRKIVCKPILDDHDISLLLEQLDPIVDDAMILTCTTCTKQYKSRQGLYLHRKTCKPSISTPQQTQDISSTLRTHASPAVVNNTTITHLSKENQRLRNELLKYKTKRNEEFYQVVVENWLGGSHSILGIGVTDVTTDTVHAEIKNWKEWKNALGQLTAYQDDCPKEQLHVYLFGSYDEAWKRKAIKIFANKGIECYEFREEERDGQAHVCIVQAATREKVYAHLLHQS